MHGNMIPARLSHQPSNIPPQLSNQILTSVCVSRRQL